MLPRFFRRTRRPTSGEVVVTIVNGQTRLAVDLFERPVSAPRLPATRPAAPLVRSASFLALVFSLLLLRPTATQAAGYTDQDIIAGTNQARQKLGLSSLTFNATLAKAAGLKSQDMISHQYFAHVSPSGVTPWYWLGQVQYNFTEAGENLAKDYSKSADLVKAWLSSSGHRKNMLNEKFEEIGVSVRDGKFNGKNTTMVVAYFGSRTIVEAGPASSAPPVQATPPPPPKTVAPVAPLPLVSTVEPTLLAAPVLPVTPSIPSLVIPAGVQPPTLALTYVDPDPVYVAVAHRPPVVLGATDFQKTAPVPHLPLLLGLAALLQVGAMVSWHLLTQISSPGLVASIHRLG